MNDQLTGSAASAGVSVARVGIPQYCQSTFEREAVDAVTALAEFLHAVTCQDNELLSRCTSNVALPARLREHPQWVRDNLAEDYQEEVRYLDGRWSV